MDWTELDTWVVITASLFGIACVLPGCFLLVGQQSMTSHGVSHAVLPGIVIAYLISGEVNTVYLLIGAVISGICCVALSRTLERLSGVNANAALGISFTSLFALGLILQRLCADHVHIEPSHVLFGDLEMAVVETVLFGVDSLDSIVWRAGLIALINLVAVILLFKELRIATFDPQHGDSVAARPQVTYYFLMILSSITAVMAFEAVGSILVVAMMIIPPAIAFQLTSNLKLMMVIAVGVSVLTAGLGHWLSIQFFGSLFGGWFQLEATSTSSAGSIAVTSGLLLVLTILINLSLIHI